MTEMEELLIYKEMIMKRREANRVCSKSYYNKTMKLGEDASLEQIQKQKDMLSKRDNYQKKYYAKNREAICERQRLYRERNKKG